MQCLKFRKVCDFITHRLKRQVQKYRDFSFYLLWIEHDNSEELSTGCPGLITLIMDYLYLICVICCF